MSILDIPIATLDGTPSSLREIAGGKAALVVNVASKCGLTPQYTGLEAMQKELGDRGFTVIGVPCNQFAGQEPGSSEEIAEFCSATYGVTFPLTEKIDVNGPGRHHLYEALVGGGDDIGWNFEKFLLDDSGEVVKRFAPQVTPEDPELRAAVDSVLAG